MDTLGTAALRERVLAAWAASPARFREDANAEEELALGAYRDRLVVELAQNAADAAMRAGVPGRLLLRLHGNRLIAANTGEPLDHAGVEGLSTLRASPKRGEASVGRFGVGFAAVLAVCDAPAIFSSTGGVCWSRAAAQEGVSQVPELATELAQRAGSVPVLRLPFPAGSPDIPDGYDTAVVLPLRDDDAVAVTRELLEAVDDALLLVLAGLSEVSIDIEGRRRTLTSEPPVPLDDSGSLWERRTGTRTWRLARASGRAHPALLMDRPAEERTRPDWSVTVAVPTDDAEPAPMPAVVPRVVHAPTPTDDDTDLPALVIADFPLDSTRRRVAPGRLTDHLAEQVGNAYARLVASFRTAAALALVPGPLGAGALDAALHRSAHRALAETAFIPAASGDERLRAADVRLVDGLDRAADPLALAPHVPGLPAPGWWRPDILHRLGAREISLADLVDELSGLELGPEGWRDVYAALAGTDLESLGALPVPLVDGRVVRGPRSTLLPGDVDPSLLEPFPLRVVHPDAAHPLLGRLGAAEATASSVLRDPAVRAAVVNAGRQDDEDEDGYGPETAAVADAVLQLVAASGVSSEDEAWLAQVPLPDAAGSYAPAHELLRPDAELLGALDVDPDEFSVHDATLRRHGEAALRAVGVRDGFGLVREADVPLDDELWHDLDDEEDWLSATLEQLPVSTAPPLLTEFTAVRDLDLVRPDAWPEVLGWLATDPAARHAVVGPAHAVTADGTRYDVEPYTSWWLRTRALVDGRALAELCTADAASTVRAVLHPVELAADDGFLAALGVARTLDDVATGVLLDRLADESLTITPAQLMEVYAELGRREPEPVDPPARLPVPDSGGIRLVHASDAVVCDGPHWLQLGIPAAVPGPARLAGVLGVDLAGDVYDGTVSDDGQWQPVPELAGHVVPAAPGSYVEHGDLTVGGVPVDWWVSGDTVHAATLHGLARGLAWVAGEWERRWLLTEALQDPSSLVNLLSEDAFE